MDQRHLRRLLALALLTAFCAVAPVYGLAKPHRKGRDAREQVLAMEQQWRQAQLSDDAATMEKLLSDDYIGITVSGQVVTKAQQLERMRRRLLVVTQFETSDTKIKLLGNGKVAIVNALVQVRGNADNRSIDGSFRYTRVYQRLAGGAWKITSFEATRIPTGSADTLSQAVPVRP